jgi:hypothetical protein
MKEATKGSIFRWIHIIFSIPILGYMYSLFEKLPNHAPATRFGLSSCDGHFGIMDVERPCRSTTDFKKIGSVICMDWRAGFERSPSVPVLSQNFLCSLSINH